MIFDKIIKKIISRELKLYRKEEEQKVREQLLVLKEECVKDNREYEHKFHSKQEERETKIALLDAKIEDKELRLGEMVSKQELLLRAKEKELQRLEGIIKKIGTLKVIK